MDPISAASFTDDMLYQTSRIKNLLQTGNTEDALKALDRVQMQLSQQREAMDEIVLL